MFCLSGPIDRKPQPVYPKSDNMFTVVSLLGNHLMKLYKNDVSRWAIAWEPCHTTRHEGAWGEKRSSSYSFSTSALDGVSVMSLPRFSPGKMTLGSHCTGGWMGSRAGLDTKVRGKILPPLQEIEPPSLGRPARSQTLYWLSYLWSDCSVIKTHGTTKPLLCGNSLCRPLNTWPHGQDAVFYNAVLFISLQFSIIHSFALSAPFVVVRPIWIRFIIEYLHWNKH
jgi:hypothetical protein